MAGAHTILIADDDKFVRDDLAELLESSQHRLIFASTGAEAVQRATEVAPDLVLLDIHFPDVADLSVLKRIRRESPDSEVIIISSQTSDVQRIVEAIKEGAFDYVPKPFVAAELLNRVSRALSLREARRSQAWLLKELQARDGALRGSSEAMKKVRESIARLAPAEGPVLIVGESGTGKELAARALHFSGKRAARPFVPVNCAAIPEALCASMLFGHKRGAFTGAVDSAKGHFETAAEGTLFLDEIGEMPLSQQAALLRVLEYRRFTPVGDQQERECRARFLFATNRDLREAVSAGKFREDLYYRIRVATLQMPALRQRPDDITELATEFLAHYCAEMKRTVLTLSISALDLLLAYDWPGNVRELRNVVESAVMLAAPEQKELTERDLPAEILAGRTSGTTGNSELDEKRKLLEALAQARGNQSEAARILGCHRNTIRSRMRYFGITQPTAQ
ncbi:MAG TPA: sigma-54 dependent transcriptional regulator [Planctomycetota bacterium]|nr:sigma-54 dependent transcriptional regulator [Planctomycetota bacterium]